MPSDSSFPLVLCTGMLRSGSTWSYNVCRLMAKAVAARERRPMSATYLLPQQVDQFLQQRLLPVPGPTVLKAHSIGPLALEALRAGRAKGICTFRDPRDCVASMITFAHQPFEQALSSIAGGLQLLEQYGRAGNTLFIRYEEMMRDRATQIRRIADFLGVALDAEPLSRIDEQTSADASKRVCEDLQHRSEQQVRRSMTHRVDPETCLHDNHIQSGEFGRWREEMSERQAIVLEQVLGPWVARLGYPN